MDAPDPGGPPPIVWDEARELVAMVLLVAAVMIVVAPGIGFLGVDSPFGFWDDVADILVNVNPTVGLLLLGSAVLVCTVQPVDVVPALRRAILIVSAVVAVLGMVALLIELTSPSARSDQAVWLRLHLILRRSAPATLLAGTAAFLARRVVPFPE